MDRRSDGWKDAAGLNGFFICIYAKKYKNACGSHIACGNEGKGSKELPISKAAKLLFIKQSGASPQAPLGWNWNGKENSIYTQMVPIQQQQQKKTEFSLLFSKIINMRKSLYE